MRGTRGMRGMSYSGECRQTFRGMSPNIPGNVAKHSEECRQTFRGMSSNIPRNVLKHSGEYRQTFRGMSQNISGNVLKHSGECPKTFLDSTVSSDDSSLSLDSYNLICADHPKNINQDGVCIYYRETLTVETVQILPECLVCEVNYKNKKKSLLLHYINLLVKLMMDLMSFFVVLKA